MPPASQVWGQGADESVQRANRPMGDPELGEEKRGVGRKFGLRQPSRTRPKHENTWREVREQAGGGAGQKGEEEWDRERALGQPGAGGGDLDGRWSLHRVTWHRVTWRRAPPRRAHLSSGPGPAPATPSEPARRPCRAQVGFLPRTPGLTCRRLTWVQLRGPLTWPRPGRSSRAGPAPRPAPDRPSLRSSLEPWPLQGPAKSTRGDGAGPGQVAPPCGRGWSWSLRAQRPLALCT